MADEIRLTPAGDAFEPKSGKAKVYERFKQKADGGVSKMYGKPGEIRHLLRFFSEMTGIETTAHMSRVLGVQGGGSTIWRWKNNQARPSPNYTSRMLTVALFMLDGLPVGDIRRIDWDADMIYWEPNSAKAKQLGTDGIKFKLQSQSEYLSAQQGEAVKASADWYKTHPTPKPEAGVSYARGEPRPMPPPDERAPRTQHRPTTRTRRGK